jgi:Ulp1 family protease
VAWTRDLPAVALPAASADDPMTGDGGASAAATGAPPAPVVIDADVAARIMRTLGDAELAQLAAAHAKAASARGASRGAVLASIRGGQVTLNDLEKLLPGDWLNDSIINMYGLLLRASGEAALAAQRPGAVWVHSTFFYTRMMQERYDFPGVSRWSKSGSNNIDIFAFDKVLIPINRGNKHWALAVIDHRARTVAYYDSLRGRGDDVIENLLRWLADEHADKKKAPLPAPYAAARAPAGLARQHNGCDCGAFVCAFMTCLAFGVEPTEDVFAQKDLALWRQKIGAACLAAVPIPDARL